MEAFKKKNLLIYLIIFILATNLTGCSKETFKQDKNKKWTMEEKLEDFEYMHKFVSDNYALLKVDERATGTDWLGEKDKFKANIENTFNNEQFEIEMNSIIEKLNTATIYILKREIFSYFYSFYSEQQYEIEYKPWFDVLSDERVLEYYGFDKEKPVNQEIDYNSNKPIFVTDIIVPDEVAYLKINEMNPGQIEADGRIIRTFFEEIKHYDKLIIDIRENGAIAGGDDLYWIKNVIEPLANKEFSASNYLFYRGDYAKNFYEHTGAKIYPTSELDKNTLDSFPDEIKTDFKYYSIQTRTIEPVNPVGFNGKIYLLVGEKTYLSADRLASFCKESGFATLVGKTTGGNGRSVEEQIVFSLPNTKMVIRFLGKLTLNGDGTIKEEVNIRPDAEIDSTIEPLYENDKAIQYVINN